MDYKYDVKIKSGTGQYYDYDNCDLLLKRCETHISIFIQFQALKSGLLINNLHVNGTIAMMNSLKLL